MREPYGEGVATHTGPESCAADREVRGEALTGVRTGWVLSREINAPPPGWRLWGADVVCQCGRQHPVDREREVRRGPTRSETPRMYGNTSHGSREIPRLSAVRGTADRIGKSGDER